MYKKRMVELQKAIVTLNGRPARIRSFKEHCLSGPRNYRGDGYRHRVFIEFLDGEFADDLLTGASRASMERGWWISWEAADWVVRNFNGRFVTREYPWPFEEHLMVGVRREEYMTPVAGYP